MTRRVAVALGVFGVLWSALAVPAAATAATASSTVSIAADINGHGVVGSTASHPVRLSPTTPAILDLRITNATSRTVTIQTVELDGRVADLTFFEYDTSVDLVVPARSATSLRFALDLGGLGGQATGLFPSSVRILGGHRQVLASEPMVADVRGSLASVYGLFGLALLVLTALALLSALLALARHRLSPNRWLRATRMLTPGIGLGLVSVFTLSATRVVVPTNGQGLLSVVIFAVVFFVLGYLTPAPVDPDEEDDDLDDEEPEEDEVVGGVSGTGAVVVPGVPTAG